MTAAAHVIVCAFACLCAWMFARLQFLVLHVQELQAISARVETAVSVYEAGSDVGAIGDVASLQQNKQEIMDTFNFRLARSRAQAVTLKCTSCMCTSTYVHYRMQGTRTG